jgi:FG-GAP repeat
MKIKIRDLAGLRTAALLLALSAGLLFATSSEAAIDVAAPSPTILAPPDGSPINGLFGNSVAASGNTLVIGAPGLGAPFDQDPGSVYVYQRSESIWALQARLTTRFPGDAFGTSVAIDGNTIVVGAIGDGTFGHAYVFVNNNGLWTEQGFALASDNIDAFGYFGWTVSISKDTIAVGAPFTRNGGSVYTYVRNPTTGFWDRQGRLVSPDHQSQFGWSTSLVGNTVVIGATGAPGSAGAVYIFSRLNNVWSQSALLTPTSPDHGFGFSTAMSGSTVVVGAVGGPTPGSASVFTQNNGAWTQQARLQGNGLAGNGFGWNVSLNGNTLAAGAHDSTYVYTGGGNNWKLTDQLNLNGTNQNLGASIAVVDGKTIAVGSLADVSVMQLP